ncbi:hypothetical protein TVAG_349630 [Trichomonas vaginalis G3]|uniref:Uncharacterized protein n=1 Tax=Trichomonas vaginalis (strain ATCC PRA-98 / G3) TaxID=412133 RepID=A2EMP0_TRIV3|nr:spectrin binding [Trichomonas vaginalis G3]EAY06110.1 hypothetical protein TVAG_349630 [Trichomonas vaginalis G3]KAI5497162.1 spectrin binding [Trichomonas vaginalis G3]|eukprot:XP_001318333.1 hypothetical protein [Trichomonas vaginalis G3]
MDPSTMAAAYTELFLKYQALLVEHLQLNEKHEELKKVAGCCMELIHEYGANDFNETYNKVKFHASVDPELAIITVNILGLSERRDGNGNTILLRACKEGNLNFVKQLVEVRVNFDVENNNGNDPLLIAANIGNIDMVGYLLSKGFKKDYVSTKTGNTLMHAGAISSSVNMMRYLLTLGLDLNAWNLENASSLRMAVIENNIDMIKFMLTLELSYYRNSSALVYAAKFSSVELFKYISDTKPDWRRARRDDTWSNRELTIVHQAIYSKRKDILEYIYIISSDNFDLKQKDSRGQKPVQFAEMLFKQHGNDFKEVYKMIKKGSSFFRRLFK